MPRINKLRLLRLTRAKSLDEVGRPRILSVHIDRIDGVVTEQRRPGLTQIVMLDGSALYVREGPDEVLRACEALGHPVGVFTRQGAKDAMHDCLE
jgi:hypothetical protein